MSTRQVTTTTRAPFAPAQNQFVVADTDEDSPPHLRQRREKLQQQRVQQKHQQQQQQQQQQKPRREIGPQRQPSSGDDLQTGLTLPERVQQQHEQHGEGRQPQPSEQATNEDGEDTTANAVNQSRAPSEPPRLGTIAQEGDGSGSGTGSRSPDDDAGADGTRPPYRARGSTENSLTPTPTPPTSPDPDGSQSSRRPLSESLSASLRKRKSSIRFLTKDFSQVARTEKKRTEHVLAELNQRYRLRDTTTPVARPTIQVDSGETPCYVMHPHSSLRRACDFVVLLLATLSAVVTPFVVANRRSHPHVDDKSTAVTISALTDLAFMFVVLSYFITAHVKRQDMHLITSLFRIARRYVTHWFFPNLLGAIPLFTLRVLHADEAFCLSASCSAWWDCAMLAQAIWRMQQIVRESDVASFEVSRFGPAALALKICRYFFWLLMTLHWVTCIWTQICVLELLTKSGSLHADGDNWLVNNEILDTIDATPLMSKRDQYTYTLYKVALMFVGAEDTGAFSSVERAFFVLFVLIGACFVAVLFGNIIALISSLNAADSMFQQKMTSIRFTMKALRLPRSLRRRVSNYYWYTWQQYSNFGSVDKRDFIKDLSGPLSLEVQLFCYKKTLAKVPLFSNSEPEVVRAMIFEMLTAVFLPGDYICRVGDIGERLYIVVHGKVQILDADDNLLTTLSDGDYFGELALLMGSRRTATAKAVTFCSCDTLSKQSFNNIRRRFPRYNAHVLHLVQQKGYRFSPAQQRWIATMDRQSQRHLNGTAGAEGKQPDLSGDMEPASGAYGLSHNGVDERRSSDGSSFPVLPECAEGLEMPTLRPETSEPYQQSIGSSRNSGSFSPATSPYIGRMHSLRMPSTSDLNMPPEPPSLDHGPPGVSSHSMDGINLDMFLGGSASNSKIDNMWDMVQHLRKQMKSQESLLKDVAQIVRAASQRESSDDESDSDDDDDDGDETDEGRLFDEEDRGGASGAAGDNGTGGDEEEKAEEAGADGKGQLDPRTMSHQPQWRLGEDNGDTPRPPQSFRQGPSSSHNRQPFQPRATAARDGAATNMRSQRHAFTTRSGAVDETKAADAKRARPGIGDAGAGGRPGPPASKKKATRRGSQSKKRRNSMRKKEAEAKEKMTMTMLSNGLAAMERRLSTMILTRTASGRAATDEPFDGSPDAAPPHPAPSSAGTDQSPSKDNEASQSLPTTIAAPLPAPVPRPAPVPAPGPGSGMAPPPAPDAFRSDPREDDPAEGEQRSANGQAAQDERVPEQPTGVGLPQHFDNGFEPVSATDVSVTDAPPLRPREEHRELPESQEEVAVVSSSAAFAGSRNAATRYGGPSVSMSATAVAVAGQQAAPRSPPRVPPRTLANGASAQPQPRAVAAGPPPPSSAIPRVRARRTDPNPGTAGPSSQAASAAAPEPTLAQQQQQQQVAQSYQRYMQQQQQQAFAIQQQQHEAQLRGRPRAAVQPQPQSQREQSQQPRLISRQRSVDPNANRPRRQLQHQYSMGPVSSSSQEPRSSQLPTSRQQNGRRPRNTAGRE